MELERFWWWIGLNIIFIGGYMLIIVFLLENYVLILNIDIEDIVFWLCIF